LLYGGITHGADELGKALQQYEVDKGNAAWGDTVVDFLSKNVPGSVSAEALQRYHKAGNKEKAMIALGAQWNALKGLGAYQQLQNIQQPFLNVNGQLFRRPGAPLPVTQPGMLGEQGRQHRFDVRQNALALGAQNKLAENQIRQIDASIADLGFTGDANDLLNSKLHAGGYLTGKPGDKGRVFKASDPNATDPNADKTPQTTIQIGGRDTLDKPTFDRAKALAQKRAQLQGQINTNLQNLANPGGTGGAGTSSAPVRVNSVSQAQQLPPGTVYLAPDGKKYRIPYPANTTTTTGAGDGTTTTEDDTDEEDDGSA